MSTFDSFATEYERALSKNLRSIPGGIDHYFQNRVKILSDCLGQSASPKRILDFGSGVGLAIPFLRERFPTSEITITDESLQSLDVATARYPSVKAVTPDELPLDHFDVIFIAGVLHHVEPLKRSAVVTRIADSIKPGGLAVFFELNPLNPVTRHLVRMCPFDNDAILMRKSEVEGLLTRDSRLAVERSRYTVFFPPLLRPLLRVERYLQWCPLGAQYFVAVRRAMSAR
ncbi:MAG: hypothetical protein RL072_498 [Actinomycetota bacterium]|jgi:2-polyprenyl-3-methyl-5-hydroxy-6-metoxy-1,4-benzoquinol methylase